MKARHGSAGKRGLGQERVPQGRHPSNLWELSQPEQRKRTEPPPPHPIVRRSSDSATLTDRGRLRLERSLPTISQQVSRARPVSSR